MPNRDRAKPRAVMSHAAPDRGQVLARHRPTKRPRHTGWIVVGCLAVLLVAAVAWVGVRGIIAKNALENSMAQVATVKDGVSGGNTAAIQTVYSKLKANTALAQSMTSDPVWWLAEKMPFAGPNLTAFREAAEITNGVVIGGLGPLAGASDGLSLDSLKPVNGAIDLKPIQRLAPAVVQADSAIQAANARAARIDTSATIGPITDAVEKLQTLLGKAAAMTAPLRTVMPLLAPALGSDGPRNYLLLFMNNAEERAGGGNPSALALVTVDHGKIHMGKQASSGDFGYPYPKPVLKLDPEVRHLYSDLISTYVQNITFTPDFPTTARLAQAMWHREFGTTVDAVIALDPVGLGYLLGATGPVALPTGDTLTKDNAVPFLLSTVYAKYPDPKVQDLVFAAAAKSVFDAVSSGTGDVTGYFGAMSTMVDQRRLLMWSARKDETAAIGTSALAGVLPVTNSPATTVGVFFTDYTYSKMSYYLGASIDVASGSCTAGAPADFRTTVKLTSTAPKDAATTLPKYVTGFKNGLPPGQIRENVVVYGPVGAKLTAVTVDGVAQKAHIVGQDKGRPVAIVRVVIKPGQTKLVAVTMSGGTDLGAKVLVQHTPRVHETPTTIGALVCK